VGGGQANTGVAGSWTESGGREAEERRVGGQPEAIGGRSGAGRGDEVRESLGKGGGVERL